MSDEPFFKEQVPPRTHIDSKGNVFSWDSNGKYTGATIRTEQGHYNLNAKGVVTSRTYVSHNESGTDIVTYFDDTETKEFLKKIKPLTSEQLKPFEFKRSVEEPEPISVYILEGVRVRKIK